MKNSIRVATNGLTDLNLLREETQSGACKGYSPRWFIILLLVVLMAGCGGSGSSGGDVRLTVSSRVPAADATGVALDSNISVTFSHTMDASTINRTTFTVTADPDTPVKGDVSLAADGITAVFIPRSYLAANTTFVAALTGVKNLNGDALSDIFWTFKTGSTLSPIVVSTFPIDFATGVPTDVTIIVDFSVVMNTLTINTTTFTVIPEDGKAIEGIVALSDNGLRATFTPTLAFAPDTQFLARVTTGVMDLNGNAMKADKAWVFRTTP